MKGVIFNLLEEVVVREHGDAAWDGLLGAAGVEGAYTSLGSYPDEELGRLVDVAARSFGLSPAAALRWFGRLAVPLLAERYPAFFADHRETVPFLLTLNDVIHTEVRKLYPGVEVPRFEFLDFSPRHVEMAYHSARRLCALAEGLIEGAADHFGEKLELTQRDCVLRGDAHCVIVVSVAGER